MCLPMNCARGIREPYLPPNTQKGIAEKALQIYYILYALPFWEGGRKLAVDHAAEQSLQGHGEIFANPQRFLIAPYSSPHYDEHVFQALLTGNVRETCHNVWLLFLPLALTSIISRSREGGQGVKPRDAVGGGRSQTSFQMAIPNAPPTTNRGLPMARWQSHWEEVWLFTYSRQPCSPAEELISRGVLWHQQPHCSWAGSDQKYAEMKRKKKKLFVTCCWVGDINLFHIF